MKYQTEIPMSDSPKTLTYYRMYWVKIVPQPPGDATLDIQAPVWDVDLKWKDRGYLLRIVELVFEIYSSKLHVADPVTGNAMGGIIFNRASIEGAVQGAEETDPDGGLYRTMILYKTAEEAARGAKKELNDASDRVQRRCSESKSAISIHRVDVRTSILDNLPPLTLADGWES